jgi:AraC-like DNA-binding protein
MNDNDFDSVAGDRERAARQAELVRLVARFADDDGLHETAVPRLRLIRASVPTQRLPSIYDPGVCVVVQGRKLAHLAGETLEYDPLNYLVISVTMPVVAQIIEASVDRPYLCVRLDVDPVELGALVLEAATPVAPTVGDERGLRLARVTEPLLDAVLRLLRLLQQPDHAPVLAPLALREIFYRVLVGELGPRLRELMTADSHAQRIARAIDVLKRRYSEPLRIDELAESVHMSASSLHHHFKAVTTLSPLQFQKQLRLHEARRLMLSEGLEATTAGHRVGYESPSQFSREYRRAFGAPPRQEIAAVRSAVMG